MNETIKKFVKISGWTALIVFVLQCIIFGIKNVVEGNDFFSSSQTLFGYAGTAITGSAAFMWAFNKWLWRWKPLNLITGKIPVLAQNYKGTLKFVWDGREQTRDTEIWVTQTYLNISVSLGTNESHSDSITAAIRKEDNRYQLIYTYLNSPNGELQGKSEVHFGTAMLRIDNPKHITGNYFTGRKTNGSMDLKAVEITEGGRKK